MVFPGWYGGKKIFFKFSLPRIWDQPSNHTTDCYFCIFDIKSTKRIFFKSDKIPELNIPSSRAPVKIDANNPGPKKRILEHKSSSSIQIPSAPSIADSEYLPSSPKILNNSKILNIDEVQDLIRDLGLPKSKGEILISRLKQWGFTGPDVKITAQRTRQLAYSAFYTSQNGICYCENLQGELLL